jgi:hypothetical protein
MFARLPLALLTLAVALLSGCNSPTAKLIGKWEADMSGVQSQIESSGNPLAGALAGMLSMVKVEAEFRGDGTCSIGGSVLGQSNSAAARWRYVKSEGNVLVLQITPEKNGQEQELRITFVDNDHFEMVPPSASGGGQKLPFKRVVAK